MTILKHFNCQTTLTDQIYFSIFSQANQYVNKPLGINKIVQDLMVMCTALPIEIPRTECYFLIGFQKYIIKLS